MNKPSIKLLPNEICTNYKLQPNEKLLSIKTPESNSFDQGIVGIFTPSLKNSKGKFALILHGRGGHKNYIYQNELAQHLSKLGISNFRFDFRGCGDSQNNIDESLGRTIEQDIKDLEIITEAFTIEGKFHSEIGFINYSLDLIVGHSRGSIAMFKYILNTKLTPLLINCSSRFDSIKILNLYQNEENYRLIQYRFGKYQILQTLKNEIINLSIQDLTKLTKLNQSIKILSIYGEFDNIVPIEDSIKFCEIFGSNRHELKIIPNSDHNFTGINNFKELNSDQLKEFNDLKLTIKNEKINYNRKVIYEIISWLKSYI
ncbi:hypothetical protein WICMUC_000167 [Wickerhamomyces mucosus]|uniref:Serine aminopeptidase S33 domain-containing protein n=1 Tax=Wickerhamomyces mucosus TaxID=1378264 RepID=A0A9P8PYS4_9ASCO|nr:hypothetical protein WICMUC_000167 [Wickerhamomyces mucosus]